LGGPSADGLARRSIRTISGYEVGGAWGPSAANAFEEVLAVKAATTNRELTDFSIINFAKHWREAVGVAILRGAAAVVAQAAPMGAEEEAGEEDETAASQEHIGHRSGTGGRHGSGTGRAQVGHRLGVHAPGIRRALPTASGMSLAPLLGTRALKSIWRKKLSSGIEPESTHFMSQSTPFGVVVSTLLSFGTPLRADALSTIENR
jgi:hypothetical protein